MSTLDTAWKQFVDNTKGSIRVTTARTTNDVQRQLAGHLGLIEASFAMIMPVSGKWELPVVVFDCVNAVRSCIQSATSDVLNNLAALIDQTFATIIRLSDRNAVGPLQIDALSALGWHARSVLCIAAGMTDRANECGRHTLDAIMRIVILTGHLRSDLMLLMREIGVQV